ncbi:4-(cytidine 5'-diphospho)-2-C-methyl-D-erythritol kinase [Beggiatoa leptomitoformis]|uniref:4-diphosphocytidyl-2-C-methyl-D-erythritol kinase n=1 Tax=Beggiatoa leptomitoformis TaxID=288004 RepID=A0A2N9YFB1_9GAMM|nr:4-(cytidine 5'-diphospho)-2-C-methyl-D-erythritol kinase [Beggiatoa leptomitoformis]ALG68570.1 4-(cytidine 5'-diphospho)-2-C-methyl-D-erythritol kinase [Beggiatoa leptomitoformis]AUI69085.1 4-(cytidine 5'-diphospho)-2-C-methyl-D-erythritol kinase [Beggiatoa leptomitoformis]
MIFTCPAPAKLNLFLHITGRRSDGYHYLQTIFQFLDYSDELQFVVREDGQIYCDTTNIDVPMEHNLAYQAARCLQQHTQTHYGVDIQIEKHIPVGGGLGGGSSDAATTLLALNKLWRCQLDTKTLMQLGLRLGADVPVFIQGHAAWAEGVGEKLIPVTLTESWFVVIHPNCHVSTAEIFTASDLTRNQKIVTMHDFLAGRTINVCEDVVTRRYPEVKQALKWLESHGSARLTGTGACVFAPFAQQEQAQAVLATVPNQWRAFLAKGQNDSPVIKKLACLT